MDPSPPGSRSECDVNQRGGIYVATLFLPSLASIVVAIRFVVRYCIVKHIGWDDWTILFAALGNVIGAALVFVQVHYGFGRHQHCLTRYQLLEFEKYCYGEWIQTFATLMWTKVSICLFLLRLSISKNYNRFLQLGVIGLIMSNIVLTLCWIFQCHPIRGAWDSSIPTNKQCGRGQKLKIIFAQAIISIVSDFTFVAFPVLLLWNVQIELKKKIGLCCLMGLGVLTGVCCIVRTVLNFQAIAIDVTYGGIPNWHWRSVEINIGIMAACIPTLPSGYKWCRRRMRSQKNSATAHLPLPENAEFQPIKLSKKHHPDRDISNALRSETDSTRNLFDGIQKTIQIDVERTPVESSATDEVSGSEF